MSTSDTKQSMQPFRFGEYSIEPYTNEDRTEPKFEQRFYTVKDSNGTEFVVSARELVMLSDWVDQQRWDVKNQATPWVDYQT